MRIIRKTCSDTVSLKIDFTTYGFQSDNAPVSELKNYIIKGTNESEVVVKTRMNALRRYVAPTKSVKIIRAASTAFVKTDFIGQMKAAAAQVLIVKPIYVLTL